MIAPLKLYANKDMAVPGMSYTPLLFPFWGPIIKESSPHVTNALVTHGFKKECFELVATPQEAEYVLLPHDYWRLKDKHPDVLARFVAEARNAGKPLLADVSGDRSGVVRLPNAQVLRLNQYRFDLPSYEVTVPVPCEDLLEVHCGGVLPLREKTDMPSIGFVGWANLPLKQRIRSLLKELPVRLHALIDPKQATREKGVFWRERALKAFAGTKRVKADFIIRNSYSGHAATAVKNPEDIRKEYIDNLLQNDYALIVRGDPNIATRLYEILAIGRIPVLVDTECVLPLTDRIDYDSFIVRVPYTELHRAPDILADFHASVSPEEFKKMQERARAAYEGYLRSDSFSPYLVEILRARAA